MLKIYSFLFLSWLCFLLMNLGFQVVVIHMEIWAVTVGLSASVSQFMGERACGKSTEIRKA